MLNIIVTIWVVTFWGCIVMERFYIEDEVINMAEKSKEFPDWFTFICVAGGVIIAFAGAPICFVLDVIGRIKH